jgi:hypothetical protein
VSDLVLKEGGAFYVYWKFDIIGNGGEDFSVCKIVSQRHTVLKVIM